MVVVAVITTQKKESFNLCFLILVVNGGEYGKPLVFDLVSSIL